MIDRMEFVKVLGYIATAIGKPVTEGMAEVYYDLLGDLPLDVFQTAAKRVVLEHKWATFPSVAELREAAAETMRGNVKELSAAEAWDKAWGAVHDIDLEIPHTLYVLEGLPPLVREAIRAFGLPAMVYGKEPVGVVRGQFLKIYEQLAIRDRRRALLPQSVKDEISRIGDARVSEQVKRIGRLPE